MKHLTFVALCASAAFHVTPALAGAERFSVIVGGRNIGHLNVDSSPHQGGARSIVNYDYKNNGRGPTMKEVLDTDAAGLPVA